MTAAPIDGAEQRASAPQGHHEQGLDGHGQVEIGGRHEAVVVAQSTPANPADRPRDDEGDVLVQPHVVAERAHARLALADADQGVPERRADDHAQHHEGQHEPGQDQVVEGNGRCEGPRQAEIGPRHRRDAVVALGQRHPAIGQPPDHHAERQGDHQEVDAGGAQGHQPEDGGHRRSQDDAHHEGRPETRTVPGGQNADAVGPEPEVGRVAERRQPRVAQDEIEAHGEDRVDQRLREQGEQEGRQERWPDRQQQEEHRRSRAGATTRRPVRPSA